MVKRYHEIEDTGDFDHNSPRFSFAHSAIAFAEHFQRQVPKISWSGRQYR